jgi:hypothetical protein
MGFTSIVQLPHCFGMLSMPIVGRVAQSVYRLSYGLDGTGSNPSGDEIFRPSTPALGPTQPLTGTGSFPGVYCGRGVLLTTHPHPVKRSWKS